MEARLRSLVRGEGLRVVSHETVSNIEQASGREGVFCLSTRSVDKSVDDWPGCAFRSAPLSLVAWLGQSLINL
jgi:hypothetical protein